MDDFLWEESTLSDSIIQRIRATATAVTAASNDSTKPAVESTKDEGQDEAKETDRTDDHFIRRAVDNGSLSFLLTVTLLAANHSSLHPTDINTSLTSAVVPVATEVLIEVAITYDVPAQGKLKSEHPSKPRHSKRPTFTCKNEVIFSRRLTWPESIDNHPSSSADELQSMPDEHQTDKSNENAGKHNDNNKNNANIASVLANWIMLPWLANNTPNDAKKHRNATAAAQSTPPSSGIVGATLCRQPQDAIQQSKQREALDLIDSMGLGMTGAEMYESSGAMALMTGANSSSESAHVTLSPAASPTFQEKQRHRGMSFANNGEGDDTLAASSSPDLVQSTRGVLEESISPPSLRLVCITSHGLICIYDPWKLLQGGRPKSKTKQSHSNRPTFSGNTHLDNTPDDDDNLVAKWLFGSDLFEQLEISWLPLSEPQTTISLSILDRDWNLQQQRVGKQYREHYKRQQQLQRRGLNSPQLQKWTTPDTTATTTDNNNNKNEATPPYNRTFVPTPIEFWNPWLDPFTLCHRTINNRVLAVHITGPPSHYLVLLGEGIRQDSQDEDENEDNDDPTEANTDQTGPIQSSPRASPSKTDVDKENDDSALPTWHETSEKVSDSILEDAPKVGDDNLAIDGKEISSIDSDGRGSDDGADWWQDDKMQATPKSSTMDDNQKQSPSAQNEDEWWAASSNDLPNVPEQAGKSEMKPSPTSKHTSTARVPKLGGFVTFCSTASWSEAKTVFLEFIPRSVAHIENWYGMELLLCIGDNQAVAIRLDSSHAPVVLNNNATIEENLLEAGNNDTINTLSLGRFQVLPVELPNQLPPTPAVPDNMVPQHRILCGAGTSPPSLLQIVSEQEPQSKEERAILLRPTFSGISLTGSVTTELSHCCVANIPSEQSDNNVSLVPTAWGFLGQGWSLLGSRSKVYFICWEGATSLRESSVLHELTNAPKNLEGPCHVTQVIQLPMASKEERTAALQLPFSTSDDVVAEAIESLSNLQPHQADTTGNATETTFPNISPETPVFDAISPLTHQKKIEGLLKNLSSWTQLEDNQDNRLWLESQLPALTLKYGSGNQHVLSLRKVVIENGPASPFSQVLGWLSQRQDYFTAASIALDLLHDPETLFHLWRHAEKIDEEAEQTKLFGLLDGIIPVFPIKDQQEVDSSITTATWTQLADMTVGCLIKGGGSMSRTLIKFLQTSKYYDPARASLMLVAATVGVISDDRAIQTTNLEYQRKEPPTSQGESLHVLWPVKCLVEIGVARDYLSTALNLLNVTIPDELRRRQRQKESSDVRTPSLALTKALVRIIMECHSTGAELLLELRDSFSNSTYWESLDDETRRALVLIDIDNKYPLLYQREVREWVRAHLHWAFKGAGEDAALPRQWLQDLSVACLSNAGCDLQDFVVDPANVSMLSVSSGDSSHGDEPSVDREAGLEQYRLEIVETRSALEPAPGSGGIDLDLLIPCLLMMRSRQIQWREGANRFVSTQALLDAACHFAGRKSSEEARFSLDASTIMQQCALSGNVRAGANLIGGKKGLVLSCCDILMLEIQVSMADSEALLLNDRLDFDTLINGPSAKFKPTRFELNDSHRQLLWLLEEHVLSIERYGDFQASNTKRGHIDPLFCARSVFRTWFCLTSGCLRTGSDWMVRWLSGRLGMHSNHNGSSQHRLACAALVRALLWPSIEKESDDVSARPLGHVLEFDRRFLVQLAQSACGLVESVPPSIANGLVGLSDATQELSTSLASVRMGRVLGS